MRASLLPCVFYAITAAAPAVQQELCAASQTLMDRIEVAELTLEGADSVDAAELRGALETQESSWVPFTAPKYFDPMAFEADLQRIVTFYHERGYPDARVAETVILHPSPDEVAIRIVVSEGEPVLLAGVTYSGFDVLRPGALDTVRELAPIRPGEPLARVDVLQTLQIALSALHEAGYAYAEVTAEEEKVAPEGVHLAIRAAPDLQALFGAIEIAGNLTVDDTVIRRQLTYRPGQLFRASALRESRRRLLALGLFEAVEIEVVKPEGPPGDVTTRITVKEGDHRHVDFSFGYGTEAQLTGEIELRHVNFLGGARTGAVLGRWSSIDRGVEGTFIQPYLFRSGVSLQLSGATWHIDERAYEVLSHGGRAAIGYVLDSYTSATVSYGHTFQSSRVSADALRPDETAREHDGVLGSLQFDVARDTTDSLFEPTLGYRASLRVERAGGWLPGSFDYRAILAELRRFHTFGRVTVAGRARYGSIDPRGSASAAPFFKRYFLGGADSLRGWGRSEVSPLSPGGVPIGGHSLFVASAEARIPVARNLGAVVFGDAGNAWSGTWDFRPEALVYDAGVGLRYDSPLGPLRLDLGYQLTPIEGLRVGGELRERRWRVHFSVGQAF